MALVEPAAPEPVAEEAWTPISTRPRPRGEAGLAGLTKDQKRAYYSRYSLRGYAEYVHGYKPARHHRIWLDEVEREILRQTNDIRIIVFDAPPGHAKSSYLSEVLPTWYLGKFPGRSVLHYTSTDNLAGLYHAVVDDTLRGDSERGARHRMVFSEKPCRPGDVWNFEKGLKLAGCKQKVSYKMSGYGSATLGLRGDLNVLDDPLTEDKATSEAELEKSKRYFRRTVWTRKQPGAIFVIIATRWGYDDLTAFILQSFPNVKLIHMPALGHWNADGTRTGDVENGDALWPEYITKEQLLLEMQGAAGSDGMSLGDFLTIFQGEPGNPEGNQLNPDLMQNMPVEEMLARTTSIVQFWDTAYTDKSRSDWCACATLGSDDAGNLFLLDMYRGRLNEHAFELQLEMQYSSWGPSAVGIEKVSAMEWLIQSLENRTLLPIQGIPVGTRSKEQRANLVATKIQQKRFYADKAAQGWLALAKECREFPAGRHDDQVDALSGAAHLLLGQQVGLVRTFQYVKMNRAHVVQPSRWMEWRRKNRRIATPAHGRY